MAIFLSRKPFFLLKRDLIMQFNDKNTVKYTKTGRRYRTNVYICRLKEKITKKKHEVYQ